MLVLVVVFAYRFLAKSARNLVPLLSNEFCCHLKTCEVETKLAVGLWLIKRSKFYCAGCVSLKQVTVMVTISLALFLESWPYFDVKLWHCQYFVEFDSFRIRPEIPLRRICEPFASSLKTFTIKPAWLRGLRRPFCDDPARMIWV